jgi:hypothetical protein
MQMEHCNYIFRDGTRCPGPIEGDSQLCFWHDPTANKEGPDIKERLQQWARKQRSLEGIVLRYAQLEGIHLGGSKGLDLSGADLFNANLKKAHLRHVDLSGANLVKTDLSRAQLRNVNCSSADLIGLHLHGAQLRDVDWGRAILQEQNGDRAAREGDEDKAVQSYREAQPVYKYLHRVYARNRSQRMASWFYVREMEIQRKMMPRRSLQRAWMLLLWLLCGYGERPLRVASFSLFFIASFAVFYFFTGVLIADVYWGYIAELTPFENANRFVDCLFYSARTFVSLSLSDLPAAGIARVAAFVEAFAAIPLMALFLLLSARKIPGIRSAG